jgi:predicted nucleic acid-binding protein
LILVDANYPQATANLVADAHLAALALEHGCQLQSTDMDFSRFPKPAWKNPLEERSKSGGTSVC